MNGDDFMKDRDSAPQPEPDQERLLPRSVRNALARELSPTRAQREHVQAAVAGVLAAGTPSSLVQQTDATMAVRAAQLKGAGVVAGKALVSKLIVSSVVIASAAVVTTGVVRRSSERHRPAAVAVVSQTADRTAPPTAAAPTVSPEIPNAVATQKPVAQPLALPSPQPVLATPSADTASAVLTPSQAPLHRNPRPARMDPPLAAATAGDQRNAQAASPPPIAADPITGAGSNLAGELAVVRAASDALDRHDPAGALAMLARYDADYGAGVLASETAALRVLALCSTKHPEAARARDAFLQTHASSTLAKRVRSACP